MPIRTCAAVLLALSLVGTACRATRPPGTIEHVVLVWLKEPGDPEARRRLLETTESFRTIPGVLDVRAGEPLPSDREIVDDSFDVALVLSLRDPAALASYEEHPLHRRAVEEVLQPVIARILVYDVAVQ